MVMLEAAHIKQASSSVKARRRKEWLQLCSKLKALSISEIIFRTTTVIQTW